RQRLLVGDGTPQELGHALFLDALQPRRHPGLAEVFLGDHVRGDLAPALGHLDRIVAEHDRAVGVADLAGGGGKGKRAVSPALGRGAAPSDPHALTAPRHPALGACPPRPAASGAGPGDRFMRHPESFFLNFIPAADRLGFPEGYQIWWCLGRATQIDPNEALFQSLFSLDSKAILSPDSRARFAAGALLTTADARSMTKSQAISTGSRGSFTRFPQAYPQPYNVVVAILFASSRIRIHACGRMTPWSVTIKSSGWSVGSA